ncbi:MAG: HupE/UreJ family protein [Alteraurantiacibacter sp.]
MTSARAEMRAKPARLLAVLLLGLVTLFVSLPAAAHPAPFSYLDLRLETGEIDGTLTVHVIDLAHELAIDQPATLLDEGVLEQQYGAIQRILSARMRIGAGDLPPPRWGAIVALPQDDAVRMAFTVPAPPPPALILDARLFSYDPLHQTFVNVYQGDALVQQWILSAGDTRRTHFAGTAAGALAVLGTFIPAGVHHILIGPDHILFIVALILLGGTWRRLALIVTAFTLGHSVTLTLAALDIVMIPAAVIEPLIALSIVVVAADNLLRGGRAGEGRDLRPAMACAFGLIHGFGFAYVLRAFGLPDQQLAVSLFGFSLGVEIGQLLIVLVVATALGQIRRRSPAKARQIATIGSLAVAAAGAYWFVDRVILTGAGQ